jgi:sn-glycerol 3-phosphate transport system permease protein
MKWRSVVAHGILIIFISLLFIPLYLALIAASHESSTLMQSLPLQPGKMLFQNMKNVLTEGLTVTGGQPLWILLRNSFVMATAIAIGKIAFSLISAFALLYFHLPFKKIIFSLILATMVLPIEVRIVPTFQIVAGFGWVNHFSGLTLPLMVSATATFMFRQFFKTIPGELVDAAKLDGAGPWQFFCNILLPLSKTQIAALFIILFVYGWNQYLWPMLITSDPSMSTIVMGIRYLAGVADEIPQWHYIMSMALLAMFPPCLMVLALQPWFEKGLH